MTHTRHPHNIEDLLLPQDVRFEDVHVEPWPDGRRVRIHIQITPFKTYPNLDAIISNEDGRESTRASIIETAEDRLVFTMHIRGSRIEGKYKLETTLSYPEFGVVDQKTIQFETHVLRNPTSTTKVLS